MIHHFSSFLGVAVDPVFPHIKRKRLFFLKRIAEFNDSSVFFCCSSLSVIFSSIGVTICSSVSHFFALRHLAAIFFASDRGSSLCSRICFAEYCNSSSWEPLVSDKPLLSSLVLVVLRSEASALFDLARCPCSSHCLGWQWANRTDDQSVLVLRPPVFNLQQQFFCRNLRVLTWYLIDLILSSVGSDKLVRFCSPESTKVSTNQIKL